MINNAQRTLLAIYLPLTLLIIVFGQLYHQADFVKYIKYAVMITLFLSTLVTVKKYREQKIMAAAFIFVVIGDFFLVFLTTFNYSTMSVAPYGITGFLLAYLCLIAAYQKNFKMGQAEILAAIPFVLIFLCINLIMYQYLKGFMFIGLVVFGAALFFMT